jgi:IrrE N-terminal-like domain
VGESMRRSSPVNQTTNLKTSRRYQHPGYAFLHRYGSLQTEADVFHYVDFLRESGKLGDRLPMDLEKIYEAFGMPIPLRVPLEDQQGILLNSATGMILIREGDPIVRQRFTEGHELMELLFDAQADVAKELNLAAWDEARKEKLCDAGAAELLMPKPLFRSHIGHLGTSMGTARSLSKIYNTSLIATLIRMVELTVNEVAIVLWKPVDLVGGAGWQLEWSVVSETWSEGLLMRGLQVTPWELPKRLQTIQPSQVSLPLRSGLRSVRSETLGIGFGLLSLLRL